MGKANLSRVELFHNFAWGCLALSRDGDVSKCKDPQAHFGRHTMPGIWQPNSPICMNIDNIEWRSAPPQEASRPMEKPVKGGLCWFTGTFIPFVWVYVPRLLDCALVLRRFVVPLALREASKKSGTDPNFPTSAICCWYPVCCRTSFFVSFKARHTLSQPRPFGLRTFVETSVRAAGLQIPKLD